MTDRNAQCISFKRSNHSIIQLELARKIPTLDLWSKNQRERENIEVDPSERANSSEDEAIPANAIKRVITLMHHAKCVETANMIVPYSHNNSLTAV